MIAFTVHGTPAPQGSKTAMRTPSGRTVLLDGRTRTQRDAHAVWRHAVTLAAVTAAADTFEPFAGPVAVSVVFRFPRPKSWPNRRGAWKDTAPDLDKLLRSTLDGLTDAGVWRDDAQVCRIVATKAVAQPGEPATPGASVEVCTLDGLEPDMLAGWV